MLQALVNNPLLAIMVVLAAGAAVGQIKFGPLRFGAAGALFVGLAVGALDPEIGQSLGIVQSLGLALFVYTVGLAAGSTFIRDIKRQWSLMLVGTGVLLVVAVAAGVIGSLLGLTGPGIAGTYSGALTATPALAAAQTASDNDSWVAVGYALAYPGGVVMAILVVAVMLGRQWPGRKDSPSLAGAGITTESVLVENPMAIDDVPGWDTQDLKASYLQKETDTSVVRPGEYLNEGDIVLLVGGQATIDEATEALGRPAEQKLTYDRQDVDFRRFTISNPNLTGKTIQELNIADRFSGTVTRVMRGDLDMVAANALVLQPGDRVLAVVPRENMDDAADFFGDSERQISEIDALAFAIGMSLGLLLGMIQIPLPGGGNFSLGTAAGPLVVGIILGAVHRTGPLQWDLPQAANLTIRQLGLLLFLAAVGLASGPAFAESMFSWTGVKMGVMSGGIVIACAVLFLVGGRLLDLSNQRVVGAFAGLIGQPAILAYATSKSNDERVESGYAAMFALGMIVKIIIVTFMVRLV